MRSLNYVPSRRTLSLVGVVVGVLVVAVLGLLVWMYMDTQDRLDNSEQNTAALSSQLKELGVDPVVDVDTDDEPIAPAKPGPKGDRGEPGSPGTDGQDGDDGKSGRNGRDGIGRRGPAGPPGSDGADGQDGVGVSGADGTDGADGADGTDGKDGGPGPKGEQGDPGKNGNDGKDGRGIQTMTCDPESEQYVVTYTDGTSEPVQGSDCVADLLDP